MAADVTEVEYRGEGGVEIVYKSKSGIVCKWVAIRV